MPDPKKKKSVVKKESYQKSDMIELPEEYIRQRDSILKEGSSGPRYKKDKSGKYYSSSTPLKQETMKKPTQKMKSPGMKTKTSSYTTKKKQTMAKKMSPAKMKNC